MADEQAAGVEFDLTLDDITEICYWRTRQSRTVWSRFGPWLIPVAAVSFYIWEQISEQGGVKLEAGLIIMAVASMIIPLAFAIMTTRFWIRSANRRSLKAKLQDQSFIHFRISAGPGGLRVVNNGLDTLGEWSRFSDTIQTDGHLLLGSTARRDMIIVPKRAFHSEEDLQSFLETTRRYQGRAE